MSKVTVAELFLRCLEAEGIDTMFGIIDGSHVPFAAHLPEHGFTYVNTRHEESAVHMAEGYARITGRPAVVIANPGPGGANMLAGLTSAFGEGHPVLAIAPTRRSKVTQPDRGGAWQATDLFQVAKPITKYSGLVTRADRLPEMLRSACRAISTGRPGPAFLAIPDDLFPQEIDLDGVRIIPREKYRMTSMGAGDSAALGQAAQWLAGAERIFMHAGKGVGWADGSAEFVALGEHLGAAMSTSVSARGVVPEDHPAYFHVFDMKATVAARTSAEVVLVVGSRLGEFDAWGLPPGWGEPDRQRTIHIDADPGSIGLNRPVDLGIVADAKLALAALLEQVQALRQPAPGVPGLDGYRQLTGETLGKAGSYLAQAPSRGVNPAAMAATVRGFFPRDAVTVLDGGNTTLWGVAYNPIFEPRSFLYSVYMGYLGTGLPFAVGAKVAAPERPVYLLAGDGAIGFTIMELETAVRVGANITVIVAVDEGWGMERSAFNSRGFGPQDYVGIDLTPAQRYDTVAEGLGCHGEYVDDLAELVPALQRCAEAGKPALVHVVVDPALNVEPIGRDIFKALRSTY